MAGRTKGAPSAGNNGSLAGAAKSLAASISVFGPHAAAVVGVAYCANWAVASGAEPYPAYGFATVCLAAYCGLVALFRD